MNRYCNRRTMTARGEFLETLFVVTITGWFTYGLWAIATLPQLSGA